MSLLGEYISKGLSANDLENELLKLIAEYNKLRNTFLFVYAASFTKNIPDASLSMDDYFIINDLLKTSKVKDLDYYIESPGGSGEAAEEIVECIHSKFDKVTFVVSGEAKSAGTIMVLSGNEIMMSDTGSLGPIDAQVKVGRMVVSAFDYMEWVNTKRAEALQLGKLNPFDATMIAQISPGELNGVYHALNFAKDLIIEWLPIYKFKDWTKTETRQILVDDAYKKRRAADIADALVDHSKWRSHGRSLKINDLNTFLKIKRIDDDPDLFNLVNRIQTVIRLFFSSTSTYKIFATEHEKILRNAVPQGQTRPMPPIGKPDVVEFDVNCPQCGAVHKLYGKFVNNPKIDADLTKRGRKPIIGSDKIVCTCGFEIDILGVKNNLENQVGKKFV